MDRLTVTQTLVATTLIACAGTPVARRPGAAPPPPIASPDVPLDESASAAPAVEVPLEREVSPAPAPPVAPGGYVPQAPFSRAERASRFPRGDVPAARQKNREGLERRAAGDAAGARAAYEAALALSPRHAPARYNLACERAREGDAEGRAAALDELETLLRLNTADTRLFVGRANFEPDFDALRGDPRFSAIVARVAFDPGQPFARQFCDDPGRVATLIDPVRGFELFVETETAMEDGVTIHLDEHVVGKTAYDRAVWAIGDLFWYACGEDSWLTGSILGYALARSTRATQCLALEGEAEWTSQYLACFVNDGGTWRLASWGMWPDGPLDESYAWRMKKAALAARDRAYARFGVAASGD